MLMTYDEWAEAGFHIIKGSKSVGRNALGQAVFDETQVGLVDKDKAERFVTKHSMARSELKLAGRVKPRTENKIITVKYRKLC